MKYTKKDLIFSLITGLITGFIAWRILHFLKILQYGGVSFAWLLIIVPLLWIIGVNLGYFLGRWLKFFNQFGKFAAIGFTNAAVDFGILNLLIYFSGIATGSLFSVFKATSFIIATIGSYFWNKFWVFEAGKTGIAGGEFMKFLGVSVVGILINVGSASIVVNLVNPLFGLNLEQWANIGAIIGSATALIWNFIGYKLIVFKE